MKKSFMKGTLALAFSAALMLGVAGISKPAIAATEETDKTEEEMVDINEETFPDANFRAYVKDEIDIDGDGQLSKSEIKACKDIELSLSALNYKTTIESLEGIEYFTELEKLGCGSQENLTSVDLSKNIKLKDIVFYYNVNLTTLDLGNNTVLETLRCEYTKMTSIDISKCTALKELTLTYSNLTSLDISNNTALTKLHCFNNRDLTSLDASNNTALTEIYCWENGLRSLNVSNNKALTYINCRYNKLTSLDVSNTALTGLNCYSNNLTSLDVSKNTALTKLECGDNELTSLTLGENTALTSLSCEFNKLSNLDVSSNTALTELRCYDNELSSLDLTKNTSLLSSSVRVDDNVKVKYAVATPALPSVANTQTGIKVTWKKATNATGYVVYRKASGGKWTKIKTLSGADTLSYVDTAVAKKSGSTYSYSIQAYNKTAAGNVTYGSYNKTGKSIRRLAQVTLGTPVNTAKGVTVKWTKVAGASGYIVYRKAGSAKTWTKVAKVAGNAKVSYLDTKAKTNGAKYTYTVKAYYGTIASSANQTGKALYYVSPTSLTGLKNSASKSVTVKWKKNAKATGYQIQYSTSSKFTGAKTVTVKSAASLSKTLSKLTKGKTYYVRVRAYKKGASANYFSAWSAAKKVKVSK